MTAVAYEALGLDGPPGNALTMIEVARDRDGVMPRILGVNHHPEIVNRQRQITVLKRKLERGNVTRRWYEERMRTLTEPIEDESGDRLLHLTASYTLHGAAAVQPVSRGAGDGPTRSACRRGSTDADLPLTYSLGRRLVVGRPAVTRP